MRRWICRADWCAVLGRLWSAGSRDYSWQNVEGNRLGCGLMCKRSRWTDVHAVTVSLLTEVSFSCAAIVDNRNDSLSRRS